MEKDEQNQSSTKEEKTLFSIDDLAAKTGVPSRTIRFYQAKGALKSPVKKGRVAYYDERHIEQLEMVAKLQERGISLRAIRDLMRHIDTGNLSMNAWLGLGDKLDASWAEDEPEILSEEQLRELIGALFRPGIIAELEKAEFVRREGAKRPARYMVRSVRFLKLALKMEAGGVDIQTAKTAADIMRRRLSKLAEDIVDHFHKHLTRVSETGQLDPGRIERSVEALRMIWLDATALIFAGEIEVAIRKKMEGDDLLASHNIIF